MLSTIYDVLAEFPNRTYSDFYTEVDFGKFNIQGMQTQYSLYYDTKDQTLIRLSTCSKETKCIITDEFVLHKNILILNSDGKTYDVSDEDVLFELSTLYNLEPYKCMIGRSLDYTLHIKTDLMKMLNIDLETLIEDFCHDYKKHRNKFKHS